jgi:ferredoxin-NADP reductase
LEAINEFGDECKGAFKSRVAALKAKQEEEQNGGKEKVPEVWQEFEVIEKKEQTKRIVSFLLQRPGEGTELDPGCFARLKLPNGFIRPYSIVNGNTHKFQLGIAFDDGSRGGSRYLHKELKQGEKILVGKITESVPINGSASNHIFIAGGIGITAFLGHINIYNQINFNNTLHYAVRSEEDIPFKNLIDKITSKVIIYDQSKGQRMNIGKILKDRVWNSQVYVCGPQRMIDDTVRASNECGLSQDEIHYEAFQIATSGDPFTVELAKTKKTLKVGENMTLLEVIREAGLELDSSCETGNCGTCKVEVCSGKVEHRGSALSEDDKQSGMLSCVSRGIGTIVIDL